MDTRQVTYGYVVVIWLYDLNSPMNCTFDADLTCSVYCVEDGLRSKRFRRAFRRFEELFAFWTRENWGKRKKCCSRSNFRTAKKRKMPRTGGKTYGNACYAGYVEERTCSRKKWKYLFVLLAVRKRGECGNAFKVTNDREQLGRLQTKLGPLWSFNAKSTV